MAYLRLGDLLVQAGAITDEQLQEALTKQKITKKRLGDTLIDDGYITEYDLIDALQMQLGIDYVDLSKKSVPSHLAQILPKSIARQYGVVPVEIVRNDLYLAMSDPTNFYAIEEVRKATKKKVIPVIATRRAIEHTMAVLYGNEGATRAIEELSREIKRRDTGTKNVDYSFADNMLDENTDSAPAIRLVNSIIERAVTERASDIHFEPKENELQVRMRVDGVMRKTLTIPVDLQSSVISRIKVMSGLDIAERRIPQDGRFNVKSRGRDIDLRVSTLPTVYGEKVVARLLDKTANNMSKENIGLSGRDLEKYMKMISCHNGVILITGPTGSGKSSTMYTMVNELNKEDVNLVTLEDPVEYNIDNVNQVQINEKTGMTFANGLRSILRQDPDIIAVGEIRDGETAEIAMRAAITGHVVLSTIHTNDALGAVERLEDIGVEPYLVSSALKGVIGQRLVRRICPNCKKPYTPDANELMDIGWDKDYTPEFYRGEGCGDCFGTGYKGRIGVFEMLPIDRNLRALISKNATREEMESYIRTTDFASLSDNAVKLVCEGITTTDEIMRVISEND